MSVARRFLVLVVYVVFGLSLVIGIADAQEWVDGNKLKRELDKLKSEAAAVKVPSKLDVPAKPPSGRLDSFVPAAASADQKNLAIERLERNLEQQTRQRLEDIIILERR